ncbi:Protein of unknown function [Pyronema omphalodes CBS 100304]|uniref:Uncharacterized protein n=1 Tax=Pyronema omphalodes (strain CBS 100304) TaxID=1076935 RepID=U4L311_PYROM|nr:Protein of unknown function [Pyronema omphalodes CBS 100304]
MMMLNDDVLLDSLIFVHGFVDEEMVDII